MPDNGVLFVLTVPDTYKLVAPVPVDEEELKGSVDISQVSQPTLKSGKSIHHGDEMSMPTIDGDDDHHHHHHHHHKQGGPKSATASRGNTAPPSLDDDDNDSSTTSGYSSDDDEGTDNNHNNNNGDESSSTRKKKRKAVRKRLRKYAGAHTSTPAQAVTDTSVDIDVVEFLRALLPARCDVNNAVFMKDSNGEHYTIVFPMSASYEPVLNFLTGFGVGVFFGTISIVPLSVCKIYDPNSVVGTVYKEKDEGPITINETMKSRLLLEKVISQVKANATMSFDYLILLITAALLAGVGLVTNNTVVIVASMLVSPLMGPVLGFTFGAVMREWGMIRNGFMTLALSLTLLVICGFVVGIGFAPWASSLGWPTPEMENRGLVSGLFIGLTIAIPSGFGVALSVLGDNTASLVGVAISASLLPPAVNTGIFFAYASLGSSWDTQRTDISINRSHMVGLGLISMGLTLLNIGCIFFSAIAMFWVKEVAPFEGKSNFFKAFTVSTNYHRRINQDEAAALEIELQQLWSKEDNATAVDPASQKVWRGKDAQRLKSDVDRALADEEERNIQSLQAQLPARIRNDENLMNQLRNLHSLVTMKPGGGRPRPTAAASDGTKAEKDPQWWEVFRNPNVHPGAAAAAATGAADGGAGAVNLNAMDRHLSPRHRAQKSKATALALNIGSSIFGTTPAKSKPSLPVRSRTEEAMAQETQDEMFQRLLRGGRRSFSGKGGRVHQLNMGVTDDD